MGSITIRKTIASDLPLLSAIETAAHEPYRAIGMADFAEQKLPTLEELEAYHDTGHAWVAAVPKDKEDAGTPIAFVLVYVVNNDGLGWKSVFIHEISVSPEYARRGIGKTLIDHVASWARQSGARALDLATYVNVPWCKPYFERLGFQVADEEELLLNEYSGVRRLIMCEWNDELLGRWRRVAMRRLL
ncbi:acyl-CoA N-acyltransferase [Lophium mytilinum]|uniref:Acyl-CoA N-acyltransferase n=1 Tax=Lophium mytilinum TaxID=390894 RepID=A0A6A6QUM1_9PEZI|nr:acyl-CoA N-acyltransferase [Lophium mytilinum]